jgi:hypothetical protein
MSAIVIHGLLHVPVLADICRNSHACSVYLENESGDCRALLFRHFDERDAYKQEFELQWETLLRTPVFHFADR